MIELGAAMLTHVFREQNNIADMLARKGARAEGFGSITIFLVPLVFVRDVLETGTLRTTFSR